MVCKVRPAAKMIIKLKEYFVHALGCSLRSTIAAKKKSLRDAFRKAGTTLYVLRCGEGVVPPCVEGLGKNPHFVHEDEILQRRRMCG